MNEPTSRSKQMLRFSALIEQVGINPCVRVPTRITKAFGKRGYVPVIVKLEQGSVASTLVPIGGGVHRLYINAVMLKCTSSRPGQRISIELVTDAASRMPATPGHLRKALAARARAAARWRQLTPSKRKEILRYLGFAKSRDTQMRNITRLLEILDSPSGVGSLCGIQIGKT